MSSREIILDRVRRGTCGRDSLPREAEHLSSAAQLIESTRANTADLFTRFAELAAATQMTSERVGGAAGVAQAVRAYLGRNHMSPEAVVDSTLAVPAEEWHAAGVTQRSGDVETDGDVYVSAGCAAVAECGAVVIASGSGRALRNDFLARTHIVVVPAGKLLASFAGLWDIVRSDAASGRPAREYCLITGPSRTADLGVPAKLGAHGPARVHALLIGADE